MTPHILARFVELLARVTLSVTGVPLSLPQEGKASHTDSSSSSSSPALCKAVKPFELWSCKASTEQQHASASSKSPRNLAVAAGPFAGAKSAPSAGPLAIPIRKRQAAPSRQQRPAQQNLPPPQPDHNPTSKLFTPNHLPSDLTDPRTTPAEEPLPLVLAKMHQLLQLTSLLEVKLQTESRRLGHALRDPASLHCPVPRFALALGAEMAALGCRCALRRASDPKQYWSKNMRSAFALCILPGASGRPIGIVVDPNFKEQFNTAHMTLRYKTIWDSLPEVYVGQATQLALLTQLVCTELAAKFESMGQVVPPWRLPKARLARWLSPSNADVLVPVAGPGRAPSHAQALEFLAQAEEQGAAAAAAAARPGRGEGGGFARGSWEDARVVITGFDVQPSRSASQQGQRQQGQGQGQGQGQPGGCWPGQ